MGTSDQNKQQENDVDAIQPTTQATRLIAAESRKPHPLLQPPSVPSELGGSASPTSDVRPANEQMGQQVPGEPKISELAEAIGSLMNLGDTILTVVKWIAVAFGVGLVTGIAASEGWPLLARLVYVLITALAAALIGIPIGGWLGTRSKADDLTAATRLTTQTVASYSNRAQKGASDPLGAELMSSAVPAISTALVASTPIFIRPLARPVAARVATLVERTSKQALAEYMDGSKISGVIHQQNTSLTPSQDQLDNLEGTIERLSKQSLDRLLLPLLVAATVFSVPFLFLVILGTTF